MSTDPYEAYARANLTNDEVEIDDTLTEADFSQADDGCWVRAWLWVSDDAL